jgi:hypothetical protein
MTIPTTEWTPGSPGNPSGDFKDWASGADVQADNMVEELLGELANFVPTGTNFGRYTIYTKASPEAIALPRYTSAIDIDGLAVANSLDEATQLTFHFKTEDFNDFKLTLLDATRLDGYNKILNPSSFTNVPELVTVVTDTANGWAGRDGTRPSTISTITCGLNDRLRRENKDA